MESIATLLTKAISNPKHLRSKDGSDALVLCLHCLLVEAGFESHGKRVEKSPDSLYYPPPQDWRQLENEWIISYTRHGAKNTFRLHCSLQTATARLFIHASECIDGVPRRENIQVLGLQLSNYTDAQRCESTSWQGVIQNERTLTSMFREFVLSPLWENAEKYEPEGGNEDTSSKELKVMLYDWGWSGKTILTTALGAAAFATIAAYVVFRYRANQIN